LGSARDGPNDREGEAGDALRLVGEGEDRCADVACGGEREGGDREGGDREAREPRVPRCGDGETASCITDIMSAAPQHKSIRRQGW